MGESIASKNRSERRARDDGPGARKRWPRSDQLPWALAIAVLVAGCSSSGQAPARPAPAAVGAPTEVASPAIIASLELREEGDVAYLEIVADRALVWTNYRDSLGNLVVELPNSVPAGGVENLMTPEGLVASIEIERLDDADRPLTRLVVRTREDSEHSLVTEGTTLSLQLLPVGYEEPVTLAYEPLEDDVEQAEPSAPAAAEPSFGTPEAPRPGPMPTGVSATRLQTVDVLNAGDTTVVQVGGDGEFTYSTFRLENPERFVIDLEGVVNTSSLPTIEVGTELVDQVRVGQFKPSPDAVSRVVFDLNQPVLPRIERTADGLTVSFGAAGPSMAEGPEAMETEVGEELVAEAPPMTPEAEGFETAEGPAETETASPLDEELGGEAAFEEPPTQESGELASAPPSPAETTPSAPEALPEAVVERLPEPTPTVAAAPPPAPVVPFQPPETTVTQPMGETRDVALFEAQEVRGLEPGETREIFTQGFSSVVVRQNDREYIGEPINMSLRNADLVETLRSFAAISNLNFVIQPGVSGSVTVELNGVPWDQAMEQILKINNLGMDIDGTIIRIAPAEQLQAEAAAEAELERARRQTLPLSTVMKSLSYAGAQEVASLLRNRSGAILSDRGTVQVDARTNTLIIRELPSQVDMVLAVIENLDTPEPQVTIEARIIEATKSFSRSLGIQWGYDFTASQDLGNTTGLQFPNNIDADGGVGLLTGGQNGFLNLSLGNILNSFNLNARLQVAENEGLVNVISAPSVTTLNNTAASIQSGLQIPVQTVSNNTVSVQFVNATLQLTVQPQVTAEGTVILNINVAKRSPQLAFAVVGATNAPIATKEASTTVIVRDGGTAVIGGIYEVTSNQRQDRVPGMVNIPILGHLFRNRARDESNDELMIFVTPRIVRM